MPSGALELAQSFRVFHKLMVTSRVIFDKANANIALYVEQQCMIHDMRKHAKWELVQEDLDFFQSQRRMIRNCVAGKPYAWREDLPPHGNIQRLFNHDDENTDSEADAIEFSKRLHEFMDDAPASCIDENGKLAPSMQCKECAVMHCSCDECRISHVITCGLLDQNDGLTTDLGWSKSSTDVSENCEKESENEAQHRPKSPPCQRPVSAHRSLRVQAARALFTLHDHYNKKEIAWGDWQMPNGLSQDLGLDEHCLNDTHTCPHSELFGNKARFDKDGFVESEAFVAAIKDVAEQIGYDIQETVIGKARTNKTSWDLCDVTKFGLELNRELRAQIKSHLSSLMKSRSCGEETQNGTNKNRSKERLHSAPCRVSCSAKQRTQKPCGCAKGGHGKTSSSDSQSDSESESSPSLADWSQVKLHNDTHVDSSLLKECCGKVSLCGAGRHKTQRELSKGEPTVSELAFTKLMVKPQLGCKIPLTPSVTRVIRKLKTGDKSDSLSSTALAAAAPKPLAASTKERIVSRVKDAHRKGVKERVLNLPTAYHGDKWTAKHDSKVRRTKATVDVLANQNDAPSDPESMTCHLTEDSTKVSAWSGIAAARLQAKSGTSERALDSNAGHHQHRACGRETDSTHKAATDKVSKGVGTSCYARSTLKTAASGTDSGSLSTTVDFNVDLNDLDLRSFSSEMAKKLREGGKLDKLIAQAVGMGATKMALSGKLEYKCEDVKKMGSCEGKDELLNYHSGNEADDMTDDDDDESAEWSECEPIEQAAAHPHRHHSCDNKKKEMGARKDTRGMHCDCCYCEMFGHSVMDSGKMGRAPQMRERLRQKLNRRNDQESQSKNRSEVRPSNKEVAEEGGVSEEVDEMALASVDEILEFINEKDTAAAQAAASRAAKRVRKKQRKQEDKERLEMERRKQEEARRLEAEEKERVKKEKQAAQQAASKEKALKAEEKRRKAAEDRARAHKRQKELREQERLQQQAKERQRARDAQAARQAALDAKEAARQAALDAKEAARQAALDAKEAARRVKAEQESARRAKAEQEALRKANIEEAVRRAKAEEAVRRAKAEQQAALKLKADEEAAREERLQEEARKTAYKKEVARKAKEAFLMAQSDQVVLQSRLRAVQAKATSCNLFERWDGEQMAAAKWPPQKSQSISCSPLPMMAGEPRPPSAPSRIAVSSQYSPQQAVVLPPALYDADRSMMGSMQPSDMHLVHPTAVQQGLFDAFSTPPPGFAPRPLSALAKPVYRAEMDLASALPAPFQYMPFDTNPYLYANNGPYYPPHNSSPLSTLVQPQSVFESTMPVHPDATPQPCKQFNGTCPATPCSSSSSTPVSSLCSTYPAERLSYGGLMCSNALRLGGGYMNEMTSAPSLPRTDPHTFPPLDAFPCHAQSALLGFPNPPANSMSSDSMAAHKVATNPMATYESETKVLAAVLEQEHALATARRPLAYEPGDPRIDNDPRDTFKPRPDAQLHFLDPTEQEIENFNRVMWEVRSDTWSRLPSGHLPGIDPQNEENAVFHFDPLV